MSKSDWKKINEMELEDVIEKSVSDLPPEDIVREVTPWRKAMNRILVGLALGALTLNFWGLNYILPAIGMVLLILGFRVLRKENNWFQYCWNIIVVRSVCFSSQLIMNATIYSHMDDGIRISEILTVISVSFLFVLCFCLWNGLRTVQCKAGLPAKAGAAAALMIWYAVLCILGLLNYQGFVLIIGLVVIYICILRSLFRLSKELDEAGYAIEAAPVRISGKVLVAILTGILVIGVSCGTLFFSSYPMEWVVTEATTNAEVEEVKEHLRELGFPEEVLGDLTDQDILECKGAMRVISDTCEYPVEEVFLGKEKELQIIGVGVELAGEQERWKLFHHFTWVENPGFFGTESIQLWETFSHGNGDWGKASDITGQLLYDKDGKTYTAAYYSLGTEVYTQNSMFWGETDTTDFFATFSMPNEGTGHRGYLAYTIVEIEDGAIVDSWLNYTHQRSFLQYPHMTAKEKRMSNGWSEAGAFVTIQDALQFYPTEENVELIK